MSRHHVIFVPGIGDWRSHGQSTIIQVWRLFGLRPHYFAMGWADQEAFTPKFARLLELIDSLQKSGKHVSLVGASGGASAVLNAFAINHDIRAVICICGKINNPQTMSQELITTNPAFKESMTTLGESLNQLQPPQRARILSIYSLRDSVIPIADTKIPGSVERAITTKGHARSIAYGVVICSRAIDRFIRQQS